MDFNFLSTSRELVREAKFTMFPVNQPEITVTVQRWVCVRKLWFFSYLLWQWNKPSIKILYNPPTQLPKGVFTESTFSGDIRLTDMDVFLVVEQVIKQANPQLKFTAI